MYQNQYINSENFYNCKLSPIQLTLVILISICTLGIGWFMIYPLCKTIAFNSGINLQFLIQKQFSEEINNLQNQIKKIEENIDFIERTT
ncbi:hypothetical protein [Candidatus Phytoplasma prunorum]|uniref:hypothetical protein n=1 Tax=Candidatus Phytoplasma prunorum TaxID=47565 RepID=UPI002FF1C12D